jgi:hypothetical protein
VPEAYHFAPGYAIVVVGLGSAERHAELIAPVMGAMPWQWNLVTPLPYVQLQQMFDPAAPWGILGYEKAVYLDEMSDGAIAVITRRMPEKSSPMTLLPIFTLGGAYALVPDDATAFGGSRSTQYVVNLAAIADTPALLDSDRAWVRSFWSELVPFAPGVGSYVNFMTEFEADRVRASYGTAKYDRLARVKAIYDASQRLPPERQHHPGLSAHPVWVRIRASVPNTSERQPVSLALEWVPCWRWNRDGVGDARRFGFTGAQRGRPRRTTTAVPQERRSTPRLRS